MTRVQFCVCKGSLLPWRLSGDEIPEVENVLPRKEKIISVEKREA